MTISASVILKFKRSTKNFHVYAPTNQDGPMRFETHLSKTAFADFPPAQLHITINPAADNLEVEKNAQL